MCLCLAASVTSNSLRPHGLQPTRLFCPWDSLDKNIRAGCPLHRIFSTQGLNPHLLHLLHHRWILYHWATGDTLCIHVYIHIWPQACIHIWPQSWKYIEKYTWRENESKCSQFLCQSWRLWTIIFVLSRSFYKSFFKILTYFCFGLLWVFTAVCRLSLVVSRGYPWLQRAGVLPRWLLLLQSSGLTAQAKWLQLMDLVAPQHVKFSWTRDGTPVPCNGRQILYHWTIREVWSFILFLTFLVKEKRYGSRCGKFPGIFFNKSSVAHTIGFTTLVEIFRIYLSWFK